MGDSGTAGWWRCWLIESWTGITAGWERAGRLDGGAAGGTTEGRLDGGGAAGLKRAGRLDGGAAGWERAGQESLLVE